MSRGDDGELSAVGVTMAGYRVGLTMGCQLSGGWSTLGARGCGGCLVVTVGVVEVQHCAIHDAGVVRVGHTLVCMALIVAARSPMI